MADEAREELAAALQSLLKSGKYTDFTVTCGSATYEVHKSIICSRSGFFERAERFKANKDKVDLPGDEAPAIKLLMQYFYEGEYDPKLPDGRRTENAREIEFTGPRNSQYHYKFPHTCDVGSCPTAYVCSHHRCGNQCSWKCKDYICNSCCPNATITALPLDKGDAKQLLLHARMYEIGDKYDVIGLKTLAREKYIRACAKYWESEQFAIAAHYVFGTDPEEDKGLRDVVSETISKHMTLSQQTGCGDFA